MINKLNFEGYIEGIKMKNDAVIKFTVVNRIGSRSKKITATVFNGTDTTDIYNSVENWIGRLVVVVGEIYESHYKDRKTNEWVNGYCVQVSKIVER